MDFRVLGPVEAVRDGRPVHIGRRQERCLLALLLLEPGRVVGTDRLVDLLWDSQPPRSARGAIHTYVARLRPILADHDVRLVSRAEGYLVEVDPGAVDAHVFSTTVADAQRQSEPADRAARLEQALSLWRGPLLADVADDRLRDRVGASLSEQRLSAAEALAQARLDSSRPDLAIGDLVGLVRAHPARESLVGLLMTALYDCGRQVEALEVYRQARAELVERYGVEPGADLRRLHERILRHETEPAPVVGLLPAPAPITAPCTLPRDIPEFVGRAEVVESLRAEVLRGAVSAPVIISVDGMAGVGKTALALRLAHQLAESFVDGQLYIDLHGHSDRDPLDPAAGLDALLRQLGIDGNRIPSTLDERAALWRATLADRRLLVVLDNATGSDQVRPLLPAGAGCCVMITSRRRLVGLDGVHAVSLDVLTDAEAYALLGGVVGERIADDPEATATIARLCGNLALALRLAAARLVHRPGWQARDLAGLLGRATRQRLLAAADGRSVATAFDLSYDHLSPLAQRVFRLLAVHPGTEFDGRAVAALAHPSDVDDALAELVDGHLLAEPRAGRYRLHDLLRDYSASLAADDPERDAAFDRLIVFYTTAGLSAVRAASMLNFGQVFQHANLREPAMSFASADEARDWFEWEYPNVMAMIRAAAEARRDTATYELTRVVWYQQHRTARHNDCLETHSLALVAAQALGDQVAMAEILNYRASAYYRTARPDLARADLRAAENLCRAGNDGPLLAKILSNTAVVTQELGRIAESDMAGTEAMRLWSEAGNETGQMYVACILGDNRAFMHEWDAAVRPWREAIRVSRDKRLLYAMALISLGAIETRRGRPKVALRMLNRASLLLGGGTVELQASWQSNLGAAYRGLGDLAQAERHHQAALDLVLRSGDSFTESRVRREYAATLAATGDAVGAVEQYQRAVALAERGASSRELALSLDGLATVLAPSDPDEAARHWHRALDILTELGLPEAAAVRERLADARVAA
jgi:DNA-binding SARP family transcriptional activator/tetratricopeptide (TPR) repeat protein